MVVGRANHEVFGVLLSKEFLEKYLLTNYPEEERTIVCSEVLEHIPDDLRGIGEMVRVLVQRGLRRAWRAREGR
jgi:2-polyprenyl-3-methyl-5-hydroxy-6-metoxy-1,4-benzoquinol methylase